MNLDSFKYRINQNPRIFWVMKKIDAVNYASKLTNTFPTFPSISVMKKINTQIKIIEMS